MGQGEDNWQGVGIRIKKKEKGNVNDISYLPSDESISYNIQFDIQNTLGKEGN